MIKREFSKLDDLIESIKSMDQLELCFTVKKVHKGNRGVRCIYLLNEITQEESSGGDDNES